MTKDFYDEMVSEGYLRDHLVYITGAGAASPTKTYGHGLTVTWISTGLYEVAWSENPGRFAGYSCDFQATTMADLKGYTCVAGDFNTSTYKIRFSITGATDALVDLTSTQKATLEFRFKESSV